MFFCWALIDSFNANEHEFDALNRIYLVFRNSVKKKASCLIFFFKCSDSKVFIKMINGLYVDVQKQLFFLAIF